MTPITSLLARGFSISVELWPPRTPEATARLERSLEHLGILRPTFASITYGAAGSTRDRTHELVVAIQRAGMTTPMAHLACAAHTRAELVEIIERYGAEGVDNLLALRGDPPLDASAPLPEGELAHAIDLVALAKSLGDFCVAVAAHPEGHPDAPDLETDRRWLAAKLDLADFAITQFFFHVDDYVDLVEDMTRRGNAKPIVPGIMPITNFRTVAKMAELSGTELPRALLARLEGLDDDGVRRVGVDIATELCEELLSIGVPGLHFYTMNRVSATLEICERLDLVAQS